MQWLALCLVLMAPSSPLHRLDGATRFILYQARVEASDSHAAEIRAEHVLVGLLSPPLQGLREPGQPPGEIREPAEARAIRRFLSERGLTLEVARRAVPRGQASFDVGEDMPTADESDAVFEAAAGEADRAGRDKINAVDVALGLLTSSPSVRPLFETYGVTEKELRALY